MNEFNCSISGCYKASGRCPEGGGNCTCFIEYSGLDCSKTLMDTMGTTFIVYMALFLVLYSIIAIASLYVLYKMPRKNKFHYAIFLLIDYCCLVRILYLSIDPHGIRRFNRYFIEILYGTGVWGLLSLLVVIVLLWVYLFRVSNMKHRKMKKYIIIGFSMVGFYFIFHTAFDVLRALYNGGSTRKILLIIYFIVTMIVVVLPAIAYLVYGRRLYRELYLTGEKGHSPYLKKITFLTTAVCIVGLSLVATFIVVIGISTTNDTQALYMGTHYTYRILEVFYMSSILFTYYFSFGRKPIEKTQGSTTAMNSLSQT